MIFLRKLPGWKRQLDPLLEATEYAASLELLAELRKPVDDFFDSVMVMDEDSCAESQSPCFALSLESPLRPHR